MHTFPKDIKFKYPWRDYQKRVLEGLSSHLKDKHLHLVAPPGSGKTVLGLEVAIRLNQPTLVLSPTNAIQNQWVDRMVDLFLQVDVTPDWISRDIKKPSFFTVSTYQGLYAASRNEREETSKESITSLLRKQNIQTIILDEAHHLKNEWYEAINNIKESIQPTIVALTATPPYDISGKEWGRYIDVNGPIDTEISVPELVEAGDLCPHQDCIYFTQPTLSEQKLIIQFRDDSQKVYEEISSDETIIKALETHSVFLTPDENLDWIYGNLETYISCLSFLIKNKRELNKDHQRVLGEEFKKIPAFNYYWIARLLSFYLLTEEEFPSFESHQKKLKKRLKQIGILEKRQINLAYNKQLKQSLTNSISKLQGIKDIVRLEQEQLDQKLRMVILTDYIRKEYISDSKTNTLPINQIGVAPIFESLRREQNANRKIGVLSGSIVIIPSSASQFFNAKIIKNDLPPLKLATLPYDSDYLIVRFTERSKHLIVKTVTEVFAEGHIQILIGTKSLLGEGWDAPSINTLILASFVGSFVTSNQMRGRAIRIDPNDTLKNANIWHLACLDNTSLSGGDDYDTLKRRFKTFVGLSQSEEGGIENGIERLGLPVEFSEQETIENLNKKSIQLAKKRTTLQTGWKRELTKGIRLVEEIKIPFDSKRTYARTKSLYFTRTIRNLFFTILSGVTGLAGHFIESLIYQSKNIRTNFDFFLLILFFGCIGFISFGGLTLHAFRLFIKHRDIAKDIHQISFALLKTLIDMNIITSPRDELSIASEMDQRGAIYCHLDGGSTYEKSMFIHALQEIVSPIEEPRYLIIRRNRFLLFLTQKDFHSVPTVIGKKKETAINFQQHWRNHVGLSSLIYTRTFEGRKVLLKARVLSLSSQLDQKIEHTSKWY